MFCLPEIMKDITYGHTQDFYAELLHSGQPCQAIKKEKKLARERNLNSNIRLISQLVAIALALESVRNSRKQNTLMKKLYTMS